MPVDPLILVGAGLAVVGLAALYVTAWGISRLLGDLRDPEGEDPGRGRH